MGPLSMNRAGISLGRMLLALRHLPGGTWCWARLGGSWGPSARSAWSAIARSAARLSGSPTSAKAAEFQQNQSTILHRANEWAVLRRAPLLVDASPALAGARVALASAEALRLAHSRTVAAAYSYGVGSSPSLQPVLPSAGISEPAAGQRSLPYDPTAIMTDTPHPAPQLLAAAAAAPASPSPSGMSALLPTPPPAAAAACCPAPAAAAASAAPWPSPPPAAALPPMVAAAPPAAEPQRI